MNRLIIAALGLSVGLLGAPGIALAQETAGRVIMTNTTATCTVSGTIGDWTILCGDLHPGTGAAVIGPPIEETVPGSVDIAPDPAPAPAAEPAPMPDSTTAEATELEATDAAVPATADQDADNYVDALELEQGLDPTSADTDADHLADGDELNLYSTNPTLADTDGDGMLDGVELFGNFTDPLRADGASTTSSSDPAMSGKDASLVTPTGLAETSLLGPDGSYHVVDTPPAMVSVSGETALQPPPEASAPATDAAPAAAPETTPATEPAASAEPVVAETAGVTETDFDADNYPDSAEVEAGLDPGHPDTDGDGVADGDEGTLYGTDPLTGDSDGDGLTDGDELFAARSDPLTADTNGEDVSAGEAVLT